MDEGSPALSIRQPWAELILRSHKRVELRSWKTVTVVRCGCIPVAPMTVRRPADLASETSSRVATSGRYGWSRSCAWTRLDVSP
jgi:hypothetical protein